MATPPTPRKVSELKPAPYNPRQITDDKLATLGRAMQEFGDLSGVIVNLTSGHLVGGHQRVKNFSPEDEVVILERWEEPNEQHTVAWGYVKHGDERWNYREVKADDEWERQANVAANGLWGDFDYGLLPELLQGLAASGSDMSLTSFTPEQLVQFGVSVDVGDIDHGDLPPLPDEPGEDVEHIRIAVGQPVHSKDILTILREMFEEHEEWEARIDMIGKALVPK